MLNDYNASKVAGTPVTFEMLQNDVIVETATVILDADGNYQFETTVIGFASIRAKASHWLGQSHSVNLSSDIDIDFSLINGDITGDNKINVLDYVVLKASYNTNGVSDNAADLNGDTNINVLDYSIMKKNYNKIGE